MRTHGISIQRDKSWGPIPWNPMGTHGNGISHAISISWDIYIYIPRDPIRSHGTIDNPWDIGISRDYRFSMYFPWSPDSFPQNFPLLLILTFHGIFSWSRDSCPQSFRLLLFLSTQRRASEILVVWDASFLPSGRI